MVDQTITRRWNSADGEKVGLWISIGILTSIVLFGSFLALLNIILGDPLREWRNMRVSLEIKQRRVKGLEDDIALLNVTGAERARTIDDLTREISSQIETITTSRARIESLLHQLEERRNRENSLLSDLQDIKMRVEQLEHELIVVKMEKESMRQQKDDELTAIQREKNAMQIAKDDELKAARREKDAMQVERNEAQAKAKVMSKRLAFVTSKIAAEQVDLGPEYQSGDLMEGF